MTDDDVKRELKKIHAELREHREYTKDENKHRRVENIQILIALGILGAAATLYSTGATSQPFWQNLLTSDYWLIVLYVFIGSTVLFLALKLVFAPLRQVLDNIYLIRARRFWEPFLYFLAVLGAVSAIATKFTINKLDIAYNMYVTDVQLATATLSIPFVIAASIAVLNQVKQLEQNVNDIRQEVNSVLLELTSAVEITAEKQNDLMRHLTILLLPSLGITTRLLIFLTKEIGEASMTTTNALYEIERVLLPSLYGTAGTTLAEFLREAYSGEKRVDGEKKQQVREKLRDLRNKAAHGDLSKDDYDDLMQLLEEIGYEVPEEISERENASEKDKDE